MHIVEWLQTVKEALRKDSDIRPGDRNGVQLYGHLKARKRVPNSKHKHKSVYDLEQGKKIGKNGKLVEVKKIKDREHSNEPHSYIEIVKDENGNIIVNKDEKLSEHRRD